MGASQAAARATAPPRVLTGREASIFACLVDGFVVPAPPFPLVRDTDASQSFEQMLARAPRLNRLGLRALLYVAELAPLALGGGARLRRLELARRRRWLARAENAPVTALRELVGLVKAVTLMCYYGDPAVMALAGYDADANVARGRALRAAEGRP